MDATQARSPLSLRRPPCFAVKLLFDQRWLGRPSSPHEIYNPRSSSLIGRYTPLPLAQDRKTRAASGAPRLELVPYSLSGNLWSLYVVLHAVLYRRRSVECLVSNAGSRLGAALAFVVDSVGEGWICEGTEKELCPETVKFASLDAQGAHDSRSTGCACGMVSNARLKLWGHDDDAVA
jgi:hypothetical protein